jgi:hypothetical protein
MKLNLARIILDAPEGWAVRNIGRQLILLSPHGKHPNCEIVFTLRKDGSLIYKDYYENGIFHREDGPAVTVYSECGNTAEELFYCQGKLLNRKCYKDEAE